MQRAQQWVESEELPGESAAVEDSAYHMFSDDARNDDSGYYGNQHLLPAKHSGQRSFEHHSVKAHPFPQVSTNDTPSGPLFETRTAQTYSERFTEEGIYGHSYSRANDPPDLSEGQSLPFEPQQQTDSNEPSEYDREMNDISEEEDEDEAFRRGMLRSAEARCFSDDLLQYMPTAPTTPALLDVEDPPGLIGIEEILEHQKGEGYSQERWQVDKESATMLASIVRDVKEYQVSKMHYHLPVPLRHCRAEIPVLPCDPDTDLRRLRQRNEINIASDGMMPFDLDDEKGESLIWGADDLNLPERVRNELESERLQVDAETMSYIKYVLGGTEQTLADLLRQECERKVIPRVSPTLLPLSPPLSPARIPPEIANIPLTSTPEDPTLQEAAELHAQIRARDERDAQAGMEAGAEEVHSFLVNEAAHSSTPLRKKTRALQSLKVLSPLLPQISSDLPEPPAKRVKTVAFSDELQTVIDSISPLDDLTDPEVGAQEATATLTEILAPLVQPALQKLQNEEFDELDTTARIPVPEVSPIKATAPWDLADSSNGLLEQIGEELNIGQDTWRGASKLEKDLPWAPFPSHLARIKPEGDFDDGSCARYLRDLDLDDNFDVHQLTWKPAGLRLLDTEEDDTEELCRAQWSSDEADLIPFGLHEAANAQPSVSEPASHRSAHTATGKARVHDPNPVIAHRHKSMLTAVAADVDEAGATWSRFFSVPPRRRNKSHAHEQAERAVAASIGDALAQRKAKLNNAVASKLASVDKNLTESSDARTRVKKSTVGDQQTSCTNPNAMEHFGQFLILQGQPGVPLAEEETTFQDHSGSHIETAPDSLDVSEQRLKPVPDAPPLWSVNMPTPKVIRDDQRFSIAVPSAVMNNRPTIRKLEKLLPAIEMVIRDSDEREREADVTVSASTGVFFTNLQKLKQKPLPGQKAFFGIREQVVTAALRYERLVVLVSEGKQISDQGDAAVAGLDQQDADALCGFIGVCSLLKAEVEVVYVPGGNEQLVDWLAAIITRYRDTSILLQEETYWGRFLRKAGFNAFTAQVILNQFKTSAVDDQSTSGTPVRSRDGVYGLAAFICMSEEDRVQRFARVLGGEGMLRRASKAIDGRWLSAANAMA
ncbi:hypothetical protein CKM354_000485100 [Cercospora kikuchii]|uniref:Uncharacterized protein n=1 Tax=Cercospora kikuchii TaxID=84275 RepID=A0A9P3FBR1_9PEZI|nr:uncharacterized protein CKM354_000485100 [Cercospora kikuchii]GIZ41551.1 hypothetical protein CKM354_000485100 [Cercospora kikuchii]